MENLACAPAVAGWRFACGAACRSALRYAAKKVSGSERAPRGRWSRRVRMFAGRQLHRLPHARLSGDGRGPCSLHRPLDLAAPLRVMRVRRWRSSETAAGVLRCSGNLTAAPRGRGSRSVTSVALREQDPGYSARAFDLPGKRTNPNEFHVGSFPRSLQDERSLDQNVKTLSEALHRGPDAIERADEPGGLSDGAREQ